ncbi:MAG: class I SAM-dependent methyltransferase [Gammaproteobacteria bacterium]
MTDHLQNSNCPICGKTGVAHSENTDLMYQGDTVYYYHQCRSCKAIYQHPTPTLEQITEFYPDDYSIYQPPPAEKKINHIENTLLKRYGGYTGIQTSGMVDLFAPILSFFYPEKPIQFIPAGKAVDVGCGNGEFLLKLQDLGWDVQGVEFNPIATDICRTNGLTIFQGELSKAAFPDNHFDLVTAHHLVEHLAEPKTFFEEIFRILKPGGQLLIRTPNSRSLGRALFGKYWFADDVPRHLILFSPENLSLLANNTGFNTTYVNTIAKTKLILKSLDYLINNQGKPSKKRKLRKWIAKLYYPAARVTSRGDEIYALFRKPEQ